jgi:hypothetical protein
MYDIQRFAASNLVQHDQLDNQQLRNHDHHSHDHLNNNANRHDHNSRDDHNRYNDQGTTTTMFRTMVTCWILPGRATNDDRL